MKTLKYTLPACGFGPQDHNHGMRFSWLAALRSRTMEPMEVGSWEDFAEVFQEIDHSHSEKDAVPLWSPATFDPPLRSNKNVRAVHFVVADVDDQPREALDLISERLAARGWAALIHTTWSHPEVAEAGQVRLRVIVPLTRPVVPDEWPSVWAGFASVIGTDVIDTACKDLARVYYIPAAPAGTEHLCWSIDVEGSPADPDNFKILAPVAAKTASKRVYQEVPTSAYENEAKKLGRSTDIGKARLSESLHKALRGLPFAGSGDRDNRTFELANHIAKIWPNATPESHFTLFERSCHNMTQLRPDDPWTWEDDVLPKLLRAYDRRDARVAPADTVGSQAVIAWSESEIQARLRQFWGTQRAHGYTESELTGWGMTPESKVWILSKGRTFWVFDRGSYRNGHPRETAAQHIRQALLPAPVQLDMVSPKTGGLVPKPLPKLLEDYGTVIEGVEHSFIAPNSFLRHDLTLVQAAGQMRQDLTPEYNQKVATWLELLGGDDHETLLHWIYWLWDLSRPCAALFLSGEGGAGKTLIANGLARLWGSSPTSYGDVTGAWNDSLLKNPLVLADEKLPTDIRGVPKTDDLREFIASYKRPLRKKFQDNQLITGAVRVILTSNNLSIFDSPTDLTRQDVKAISDRLLYLPVSADAVEYLSGFSRAELERWVTEDIIARHALWIRHNMEEPPVEGRFLVKGSDPERIEETVTMGSGLRSRLLEFFAAYLKHPDRLTKLSAETMKVWRGQIRTSVRAVEASWDRYITGGAKPSFRSIRTALEGMCTGKQHGGIRVYYVEMLTLERWAQDVGYFMPGAFQAAVKAAEFPHLKPDVDIGLMHHIDPYAVLGDRETAREITPADRAHAEALRDAAPDGADLRVLLFLEVLEGLPDWPRDVAKQRFPEGKVTLQHFKKLWERYLPDVPRPKQYEITRTLDIIDPEPKKMGNHKLWLVKY